MNLGEQRYIFTRLLAKLIEYINSFEEYECSLGDVYARDGHCKNSFHYKGLAADINLFKRGEYCRTTEEHKRFGEYWKSLNKNCTWGGDFKRQDGNHYSFGEH